MNKIKIAGAGISGLTASIVLARAGYEVEVHEKNDKIGVRFNEDFQGIMNWGFDEDFFVFLNKIGVNNNFWNKPLTKFDLYGPEEYKENFELNRPFCYIVQRGLSERCLDQSLKTQAEENGVNIIYNSPKNIDEVDIIATGPHLDGYTDGLVVGITFKSDSPDNFSMIFDDKYAYNGYSYFLMADGHGTIATCIFGNYDKVNQYYKKTFDFFRKHYDFNIKEERKFTGTGNFYLLNSNKKYIGEAGGFQDYLWGFGMRYAMLTGYLAAKSIIEKSEYKKLWKKELDGLLKTSISNRFWFTALGRRSYKKIIKFLKSQKDPALFFHNAYRPGLFSKILYPVASLYLRNNIKDRTSK